MTCGFSIARASVIICFDIAQFKSRLSHRPPCHRIMCRSGSFSTQIQVHGSKLLVYCVYQIRLLWLLIMVIFNLILSSFITLLSCYSAVFDEIRGMKYCVHYSPVGIYGVKIKKYEKKLQFQNCYCIVVKVMYILDAIYVNF